MPDLVVDASLAAKWVIEESYSGEARTLLRQWAQAGTTLYSHAILPAGVSNAIYKRVKRGELPLAEALEAWKDLWAMPIVHLDGEEIGRKALVLAKDLDRPATYDALYLATAELLESKLWTADDRLYHAAVQGGLGWVRHVRDRLRLIERWGRAPIHPSPSAAAGGRARRRTPQVLPREHVRPHRLRGSLPPPAPDRPPLPEPPVLPPSSSSALRPRDGNRHLDPPLPL
jgi:predicted nucleic acid-binding protein